MPARRTSASQSSEPYGEEDTDRDEFAREATSQQLLLLGSVEEADTMKAVQSWLDRSPPPYDQAMNSALAGEEEEEEEEKKGIASTAGERRGCLSRVSVTGSCLCKLSIVIYLLACVLVSALYVAIYGPNELYTSPDVGHPRPGSLSGEVCGGGVLCVCTCVCTPTSSPSLPPSPSFPPASYSPSTVP